MKIIIFIFLTTIIINNKINERILFFDMDKAFNNDTIEEDVLNVTDHFIKLFQDCISNTLIRNLEANVNDVMGECLGEGDVIIVRLFKKISKHAFHILKIKLNKVWEDTCKNNINECSYFHKFVNFCIEKNYIINESIENSRSYLNNKISSILLNELIKISKSILIDFEWIRKKLYKKRKDLMIFIQDQYTQKEEIAKTFKSELLPQNQLLNKSNLKERANRLLKLKLKEVFSSKKKKYNFN